MVIFEDEILKITSNQGEGGIKRGSSLLSFTGIGHAMGGINVQRPEFFGSGRSFDNIIYVIDKERSWGNNFDFKFIKNIISPHIEGKDVYSIGNSMGGFNAIVSTFYIPTIACVAFVPQYSVNPSVVPWETRWKEYTSEIKNYRFNSVDSFMSDKTKYFVLSGGSGLDYRHAQMFPVKDNIFHYSFRDIAHNLAQVLKREGILDFVIQSCMNGSSELRVNLEYERLSP